ncbi:MAG TPA: inositol monophosphatase family protein [Candidatus Limnocylindria bacterium]|nr:inositol monophosphatase family protein [Candidatus Limnocylindria bacterium]
MRDLEVALAAAAAGAAVVRDRFGLATRQVDKGLLDFATDADIDAERAICDVLQAERPKDALLGEESGRTAGADNGRVWLVDPLCGTTNYAANVPLVAVNVALSVDGRGSAAVAVDPFRDEVFWADGAEAGLRAAGKYAPIAPRAEYGLVDLNLDRPYPSAPAFTALGLMGDREFRAAFAPRVLSTTLALTWVAAGRRAAYVSDGFLAENVHFAAGVAICRAAGCVVTDLRGGELPPDGAGFGLIAAADDATHRALLEAVTHLSG